MSKAEPVGRERAVGESAVDSVLDTIAETSAQLMGADRASVVLLDSGGQARVRAVWGFDGDVDSLSEAVTAGGGSISRRAIVEGVTIVIERVDEDRRISADHRRLLAREGGRTVLATPLTSESRALGALVLVWKEVVQLDARQLRLAETLAHHAATVVDKAQVLERERTLRELTAALATHLDEARVLELAVGHAARLLEAPYARVWLIEDELRCAAAEGFAELPSVGERLPADSVAGLAVHGLVSRLDDAPAHPSWVDKDFRARTGLAAYIGAAIRRAGQPLGVLEVMRERARPFTRDDESLLAALADALAVAVANARLYREAQLSELAYRELFEQRLQAEEALREAERRASQTDKLRALGQMAGGIAHDLNQQLGLVVGHGDLALQALERGPLDAARVRDSLGTIVRAAVDGGETVKRLLLFSKADPEGPPETVDLGALLHDVAKLTAPKWRDAAQLEGRAIALSVESDAEATVTGWPASLREAFANLVLNAVDALPEGGTIRLRARRRGGRVEATVEDSGVGMSSEVQSRAFEPFFTTKGERGTGLGLSVVFGIVERHDGQIAIESTPGQGTTFRLSFAPAREEAAAPMADEQPAAAAALRVLVVDDEVELREMAALMLQLDGHAAETAGSGEDALARLEDEQFDLVLSDVGMGAGMNGWELAEQVRARWPRVRVVMATGWGSQIDPGTAAAKGIEAVIAKPYRIADLRAAVNR